MEKTYLNVDEKLVKLRADFESGKIKQENMSNDEIALLSFVYQLQMLDLDEEISEQKKYVEEYKIRLKNAIEYLKNKNNNNNNYDV